MRRFLSLGAVVLVLAAAARESAGGDKQPAPVRKDSRLTPKDYDGYFPWTPPATKKAWENRRAQVRRQVLVANGLWPLPEKTPLKPTIHGKIERDGYTVEKVFFASYPGHYVTGNLYRPTGKTGKLPAVLCPHGHWANGRFYDLQTAYKDGEERVKREIKSGAEKTVEGARYPLQARCAQLARMGCVVFHYDMVGYADSKQIGHRAGFDDPEAELRLQSFMGLQTWNAVRALDFLLSLDDVDPTRVGVTGASGGGTQTFILCAIDDRPAAAFPAVMVSTEMQGGCICENCSLLRVGTGNIELAAVFAPKPLGMSGAEDWTKAIEGFGLPALKSLYRLYGAEDNVMAKANRQFGHNYNQVSRELMYNWFNKHLKLGHKEPITEKPFVPVPPKELSVFDAEHPLPKDAVDVHGLRRYLTESSDKQLAALLPKDKEGLGEFRKVIGPALRAMVTDRLPGGGAVEVVRKTEPKTQEGVTWEAGTLSRKGQKEVVEFVTARPAEWDGTVVVTVHPRGVASVEKGGELEAAVREILKRKATVLAVQPLLTGPDTAEAELPITKHEKQSKYQGYTFGYNRSLAANRVHDILTAIAYARGPMKAKKVHIVGFDRAGPWVMLARALCGAKAVGRTAADLNEFRFERLLSGKDDMMLPGALKYGGLPALAGLCAPGELYLHNTRGTGTDRWLQAAYAAAGAGDSLRREAARQSPEAVVAWLLR